MYKLVDARECRFLYGIVVSMIWFWLLRYCNYVCDIIDCFGGGTDIVVCGLSLTDKGDFGCINVYY